MQAAVSDLRCPSCFNLKHEAAVCERCGFDESSGPEPMCLPYRHPLQAGRYLVGVILGSPGGFGVAYKAWSTQRHAVVVIKEFHGPDGDRIGRRPGRGTLVVDEEYEDDYQHALAHFRREAATIRKLTDPHIVRVIEAFDENHTHYYVMPFVEGSDLDLHLRRNQMRITPQLALKVARGALLGLRAMHGKGQIHCDVKPSNILLEDAGDDPPEIVLIDFGAVRQKGNPEQLHSNYTEQYAAPELIANDGREICEATDIFLLGATLYRCLTGAYPASARERLASGIDPYRSIATKVTGLAPGLVTLIDRGLELERAQRPQSAEEALALLPPIPGRRPAKPWPRPRPEVVAGLSGIVALLAFAAGQGLVLLLALAVFAASLAFWKPWARTGRDRRDRPVLRMTLSGQGMAPIVHEFAGGQKVYIGRSASNRICIPGNVHLSGQHVSVQIKQDGHFTLTDLDSVNHTYAPDPGQDAPPSEWERVREFRGYEGRFMLGSHDVGGVLLEISPKARHP